MSGSPLYTCHWLSHKCNLLKHLQVVSLEPQASSSHLNLSRLPSPPTAVNLEGHLLVETGRSWYPYRHKHSSSPVPWAEVASLFVT